MVFGATLTKGVPLLHPTPLPARHSPLIQDVSLGRQHARLADQIGNFLLGVRQGRRLVLRPLTQTRLGLENSTLFKILDFGPDMFCMSLYRPCLNLCMGWQ